jgi:hypothetical protein
MNGTLISSAGLARRSRMALVAALAVACLLATAATASADQFNPFTNQWGQNLTQTQWLPGGCYVVYGPVVDPAVGVGGSNYRTIGGASVNCDTGHHTIGATVREYAAADPYNGPFYQVGNGIGTVFTNSAGFGSKILELNLGCTGYNTWYWQTRVYVTIDSHAYGWYYSPWSTKPYGC